MQLWVLVRNLVRHRPPGSDGQPPSASPTDRSRQRDSAATIVVGTRKFCHDNPGHVYNRAEIATMANMSWHGRSGPPMTSCGGHNCRRHWQAVDPDWLREQGRPPGSRAEVRAMVDGMAVASALRRQDSVLGRTIPWHGWNRLIDLDFRVLLPDFCGG